MDYPVSTKVMQLFDTFASQTPGKASRSTSDDEVAICHIADRLTDDDVEILVQEFYDMRRFFSGVQAPPHIHPAVLIAVIQELRARDRIFDFTDVKVEGIE